MDWLGLRNCVFAVTGRRPHQPSKVLHKVVWQFHCGQAVSYHLGSHVQKVQLLDFKPLELKLPVGLYAFERHALVVVT